MTTLTKCRLCKSSSLTEVINLGEQYITSRFPVYGDWSTPKVPISLSRCNECFLLQTSQTTSSADMYEHEYGYRSGISNTMRAHLKTYQEEILRKVVDLKAGDVILDIGSNDATMLQYYDPTYKRIGVDPTGKQFQQYYGNVELVPTYFTKVNFQEVYGDTRCKVVSSISMFYDLPDPVQFAADIYDILDADGIWTCEQSYLLTMLQTNSIDTICHEHLEYYAIKQIKDIADRTGFKIIDISFNDCNGGSSRVYFAKKSSTKYTEMTISKILQDEASLTTLTIYNEFMSRVNQQVNSLKEFIMNARKEGKETWIYGASTKGNCLLQYANLGEDLIQYAVERNPQKIGKMTATGIPIISEETMRSAPPAYLLVLPWHFRKEITEREQTFLREGGGLIFPFPVFDVVNVVSAGQGRPLG